MQVFYNTGLEKNGENDEQIEIKLQKASRNSRVRHNIGVRHNIRQNIKLR